MQPEPGEKAGPSIPEILAQRPAVSDGRIDFGIDSQPVDPLVRVALLEEPVFQSLTSFVQLGFSTAVIARQPESAIKLWLFIIESSQCARGEFEAESQADRRAFLAKKVAQGNERGGVGASLRWVRTMLPD